MYETFDPADSFAISFAPSDSADLRYLPLLPVVHKLGFAGFLEKRVQDWHRGDGGISQPLAFAWCLGVGGNRALRRQPFARGLVAVPVASGFFLDDRNDCCGTADEHSGCLDDEYFPLRHAGCRGGVFGGFTGSLAHGCLFL